MQEVKWPMDVSPFFDEAQVIVGRVREQVRLESAILDDWNVGTDKTGTDLKGPRIIWGKQACCLSDCNECDLSHVVGVDRQSEIIQDSALCQIRPELCFARKEHLAFLPRDCKQYQLNCKTHKQFQNAYVAFFMKCCLTEEEMHAEIAWVIGFRLLYLQKANVGFNRRALLLKELEMKREIIGGILRRLVLAGEAERLSWFFRYNRRSQDFGMVIKSLCRSV